MAYDSVTPQGNQVNANLYKQYQDYVVQMQSNGQQAPTYDQWLMQQQQTPNVPNRYF